MPNVRLTASTVIPTAFSRKCHLRKIILNSDELGALLVNAV